MRPTGSIHPCSTSTTSRRRAALLIAACCALLSAGGPVAADDAPRVTLQHDPRYVLESVARRMNVTLRADEPMPRIYFESSTPLEQFQDAVAPQWRFRPPMFANVYVMARNEIYLSDDAGYYRRLRRTLDESLAHEFAHYLQVRYFAANLADEGCETEAVAMQIAFREENQLPYAPGETG
jgi:hypothetical protein